MDKVVHFEIPAENLERAQAFYKNSFGWVLQKAPMPGVEYYMITTVKTDQNMMPTEPGAINGGLMKRDQTAPTPVLVIKVDSLAMSLKKVQAEGAVMVQPTQTVGDMGLYARVKDTEGNIIGMWQDLPRKS